MKGINICCLGGNLTRDIELKYTQSGKAVASVGMAINNSWTDKQGQKVEKVDFVNLVFWNKAAEIVAQYTKKGSGLFVRARVQVRKYEHEGIERTAVEFVVDEFNFVGGKPESKAPAQQAASAAGGAGATNPDTADATGKAGHAEGSSEDRLVNPEKYDNPDKDVDSDDIPF